jgi:glutamine amidotransferase
MKGIESNQEFYFVHSYHLASLNEEIDAYGITNYEYDFVSLIEKNNIFGVQFHPEKSFEQGEMILKNFVNV